MLRRMTGKGAATASTRTLGGEGGGGGKGGGKKEQRGSMTDEFLEAAYGLDELPATQAQRVRNLLALLKAIRECNKAKTLDESIALVISATCAILGCDRATLFMVDEIAEELVIRHAVGADDIRIPLTAGIAGAVYQEGKSLNIADPYNDPRFNKETDKATGYKTESILCLPIVDQGKTIAVLQAINKKKKEKGGFQAFTDEDEMHMEHLATQVSVILSNQLLSERTQRTHAQVISMLEIVKSLHGNMGMGSLLFTITERSPALVDADRCTVYLFDSSRQELMTLQGAVEVRVPIDKGLVGAAATSGEIINIKDAWDDARFNKDFDRSSGYRTRSVLVMPIRDTPADAAEKPTLVGVLQLINKKSAPMFTEQDIQLLQSFVDIVGNVLAASQLFQATVNKKTGQLGEASLKDLRPGNGTEEAKARVQSMKKSKSRSQMRAFKEEDMEEGEGEDANF